MKLNNNVVKDLNKFRKDYNKADSVDDKKDILGCYMGYISCLLTLKKIDAMEAIKLADLVIYPEHAEELEELNE